MWIAGFYTLVLDDMRCAEATDVIGCEGGNSETWRHCQQR
jgi:hypothetical protein